MSERVQLLVTQRRLRISSEKKITSFQLTRLLGLSWKTLLRMVFSR
eukprot:COSAG02_NODE_7197_length_3124_cov_5.976198_4_plen_45_part_01